jgi:ABC-type transport system involved in multi-copper enzyme maturation permease subunit
MKPTAPNRFPAWVAYLGLGGWAAGAGLLWVVARQRAWSPGELVLAAAVWVLVLAVVAREPVRNLFGPVFWYEVTRVGRRFSTFLFRFLYVAVVGMLLGLMFMAWWEGVRRYNSGGSFYETLQQVTVVLYFVALGLLLGLMSLAWREDGRGKAADGQASPVVQRFTIALFALVGVMMLVLASIAWWEDGQRKATEGLVNALKVNEFATSFFTTYMVVQYFALLVMTPAYVAGAITDEKERKTIDYLFTTDLANREIVFGKLAARVATVTLFVLAGLPVLAFMQLFGGIDPDLVLAGTAVALVTVFGLSAVGIAISAASRRSRDAIVVCYGLLLLYLFLSLVLALVMKGLSMGGWTTVPLGSWSFDLSVVSDWLATGNAMWMVPTATNWGREFEPDVIVSLLGRYAAFWGVASVVSIGWAVTRLRRVTLAHQYGVTRSKRSVAHVSRTRPEMGDRPLVWREVFAFDKRLGCFGAFFRIVIALLVAVVPVWGAIMVFFWDSGWGRTRSFTEKWEDYGEGMNIWVRICTGVLGCLILFAAALRGAAAVAGEKDRDTWVSLCTTPISAGEFLYAKWLGAVLSARFALWALVGVWAVGLALGSVWWFVLPVSLLYLFVFTSAFALAGIWCSVRPKTALRANVKAFFLAAFMAGGFWPFLLMCCGIPLGMMRLNGEGAENLGVLALGITPPFVVGMMPIGSFERYHTAGPGMFHPETVAAGPCALIFGLVFWGVVNLVLWLRVRHLLTDEMNRGRIRPDDPNFRPPPRRRPVVRSVPQ